VLELRFIFYGDGVTLKSVKVFLFEHLVWFFAVRFHLLGARILDFLLIQMVLINLKQEYFTLSVFFVVCLTLSSFLLLLSYSISKTNNDVKKLSAYECGFDPFGAGVASFEVHFYLVGILFIIFDLEIIFLYP
jgi:hypothetical protein